MILCTITNDDLLKYFRRGATISNVLEGSCGPFPCKLKFNHSVAICAKNYIFVYNGYIMAKLNYANINFHNVFTIVHKVHHSDREQYMTVQLPCTWIFWSREGEPCTHTSIALNMLSPPQEDQSRLVSTPHHVVSTQIPQVPECFAVR